MATFSARTDWDLSENDLAVAVRKARSDGRELHDLTVSNPTACGFTYDAAKILERLAAPGAMLYEPSAFGMQHSRRAVAQYYAEHDIAVAPEHVCLTTSTSEGYSFLFRLLCDPEDEVLVARPSYPLFDFIARLDAVTLREYPLLYDNGWQIDLHALEQAITSRTKAIVVVHPNNPTGNYASSSERAALDRLCVNHRLALIVDEVFLDYPIRRAEEPSFLSSEAQALTFVLSGVSKVCGLPQMKLSWIVVSGSQSLGSQALARLDMIADTFLSVSAPTQYALPDWLESRASLQSEIKLRIEDNLASLENRIKNSHANQLTLEGGWTVVLRVPRQADGVPFARAALDRGSVVQPGELYGLSEGQIVLSLLTPVDTWRRGLEALPIS